MSGGYPHLIGVSPMDKENLAQTELLLTTTELIQKDIENIKIPLESIMEELLERSHIQYMNSDYINVYEILQMAIQQASTISYYRGFIDFKQKFEEEHTKSK